MALHNSCFVCSALLLIIITENVLFVKHYLSFFQNNLFSVNYRVFAYVVPAQY